MEIGTRGGWTKGKMAGSLVPKSSFNYANCSRLTAGSGKPLRYARVAASQAGYQLEEAGLQPSRLYRQRLWNRGRLPATFCCIAYGTGVLESRVLIPIFSIRYKDIRAHGSVGQNVPPYPIKIDNLIIQPKVAFKMKS